MHIFAFWIIFFFAKDQHVERQQHVEKQHVEKQHVEKKQQHVERATNTIDEVRDFVYSEELSEGGGALQDIMPDVVHK